MQLPVITESCSTEDAVNLCRGQKVGETFSNVTQKSMCATSSEQKGGDVI